MRMPKDSNSFKQRFQYYKQTGKLPYKAGRIDDEQIYRERMKDVARENYEQWGYNSPADAWQDAINDPTYDYRGYYSDPEFQNVNANSQTHWPDRYKTPLHRTFSSDSKYHGKQSEKNPYGLRGGQWVGDKFIPAAWQNPIRIPHYAGGRDGELPTDAIQSRQMPIELQQDPLGMQKRLDIARANAAIARANAAKVTAMQNQAQVGTKIDVSQQLQNYYADKEDTRRFMERKREGEELADKIFGTAFDVATLYAPAAKAALTGAKVIGKGVGAAYNAAKTYAGSRLYSNNPIVNLYATLARRYDLPDKARLPYLIRSVKSDNISFNEGDLLQLNGKRFGHTNFSYDRKVVPHKKGSWDNAQITMLVNPRQIVPNNKWGSIEPSDMFTIKDPAEGLYIPKKDVVIISGNPNVQNAARQHNVKIVTNDKLKNLEKEQILAEQAAEKANAGKRFAFIKSERHLQNRGYWDAVYEIQRKFGLPKVKDVRLLESTTGLNSYIQPVSDLQKFNWISYDDMINIPINKIGDVVKRFPNFLNGRKFNYMDWNQFNGLTFPYKNFFYDPATTAESKFIFPK